MDEERQFLKKTLSNNIAIIKSLETQLNSFARSQQNQAAIILELKAQNSSFQKQIPPELTQKRTLKVDYY